MDESEIKSVLGEAKTKVTEALYLTSTDKFTEAREAMDTGLKGLDSILAEHPDNLAALAQRVKAYDSLGRYPEALTDLDKLLTIEPENAEFYNRRARVKLKQGDTDGAIQDYLGACRLNPIAKYFVNLGVAYKAEGKLDEAIRCYDKAIDLQPDNWAAYHNRGRAFKAKYNYKAAMEDFNQAIELGDDALTYIERSELRHINEDFVEAQKDAHKAVQKDPRNPEAYKARFYAYQKRGLDSFASRDFSTWQRLEEGNQARQKFLRS